MASGVSIDLIVDPKKAIDGLGQVQDKSTSVSKILGGLGGVAAAGVAALGTAAVGAVAGLTAATKSAGEYAENVALTASRTHLSTDAVQELQYAAKVTHVDIDTITGSMTKLTKSMGAAESGTGAQADAFKTLGVATQDSSGNLLDSTVVYSNVIAALGKVENPAQRDVLAMQLLGKSATQLNPLIDGSAGSLSDLAKEAQASGSVLSGAMLDGLGNVDDAFDKLDLGVAAAKNALGLTLMPILQELGDQGSGLLGKFTNAVLDANGDLSKAAPEIGAVFGDAATFILGEVPKFLEVGTSIVTSLVTGIADEAPTLIQQAVPVLVAFVAGILGLLPTLIQTGVNVLVALLDGVTTALPTLIPAVVTSIISAIAQLFDPGNLTQILQSGLALVIGLVTGIIKALPVLIAALPQIIVGLITFLIGAIPQLIDAGISLLTALVTALPVIITAIVNALPQIIVGIVTALISAIPQLIEAGIKLFIGLIEALPQIIIALVGAVPQIIQGLVKAFTDPATLKQVGDAGLQLIHGLWDGIKGAGDWLWKQLKGFFGGIIDQVKGLLGIHSPSTVFASMGGNLIAGLVNGISGGSGAVASVMSSLSSQVTDGFGASLNVQARATVATQNGSGTTAADSIGSASTPSVNQQIYLLPEQDPRIVGRQLGREFTRFMAGMA